MTTFKKYNYPKNSISLAELHKIYVHTRGPEGSHINAVQNNLPLQVAAYFTISEYLIPETLKLYKEKERAKNIHSIASKYPVGYFSHVAWQGQLHLASKVFLTARINSHDDSYPNQDHALTQSVLFNIINLLFDIALTSSIWSDRLARLYFRELSTTLPYALWLKIKDDPIEEERFLNDLEVRFIEHQLKKKTQPTSFRKEYNKHYK